MTAPAWGYKKLVLVAENAELPIRTYFDEAVGHLVKVYAPRMASGDLEEEIGVQDGQ